MSILMACYIAISPGQYQWVEGREVATLKAGKLLQERSYFVPTDAKIPATAVETNDCKYLEDPVLATVRELEARKIDAIKVGNRAWCHVDEYGRQICTYDTMQQCLKVMKRGDYCEPNKEAK